MRDDVQMLRRFVVRDISEHQGPKRGPKWASHREDHRSWGKWVDFGGYLSRSLTDTLFTIPSWFPAIISAMYQQVRNSQVAADETRECENCRAQMKQLGELRAIGARPSVKVYRCYECNRIASEPN
jgi:hypothetical protein